MSINQPPYNPYQAQPFYPDRRDPQQVRQRVYPAAIALMIVGIVGAFLMFGYFGFSLLVVLGGAVKMPPNAGQNPGLFWFGVALPHLAYLLNAVANIFIAYAGYQMMHCRNYMLCMTGSIAALIPCFSACCVLGIPFGIWGLVVLTSEGARDAFERH